MGRVNRVKRDGTNDKKRHGNGFLMGADFN